MACTNVLIKPFYNPLIVNISSLREAYNIVIASKNTPIKVLTEKTENNLSIKVDCLSSPMIISVKREDCHDSYY